MIFKCFAVWETYFCAQNRLYASMVIQLQRFWSMDYTGICAHVCLYIVHKIYGDTLVLICLHKITTSVSLYGIGFYPNFPKGFFNTARHCQRAGSVIQHSEFILYFWLLNWNHVKFFCYYFSLRLVEFWSSYVSSMSPCVFWVSPCISCLHVACSIC